MAFRRKDIKKSSYYVWFLGAKEAEGLRGEEFVLPVLRYLIDQESISEVSKVTLQVSSKGLKIIQNVPKKTSSSPTSSAASSPLSSAKLNLLSSSTATASGKTEQIKHLIPHNAITCVVQEEDLVACILLIYNPITKCPVHVHAYRCDSIETASSLRGQLQLLIERPENQRKFKEIESRLVSKGLTINQQQHQFHASPQKQQSKSEIIDLTRKFNPLNKRCSSESRSTRTESSDRTEDSYDSGLIGNGSKEGKSIPLELALGNPKVAILYESLAAELKAKLSNPKSGPILLPPKDYDTISRKHGKLTGIEARKSTNLSIVGPLESSSTSSSSPQLLNGAKGDKKMTVTSSLSTSSASSASSSSIPKKSLVTSPNPITHCDRSESSCKSSSGIGSDEPDQLSSTSTSPFNNGKSLIKSKTATSTKVLANFRGDISSDDSERNWSPIESGPSSSSASATSSGLARLLNQTSSKILSNNNNINNNQNKIVMITTSNNSKNNHHYHHHLLHPHSHISGSTNFINTNHKTGEKLDSNRLSGTNGGNHHQPLSSSTATTTSSSLSPSPSSSLSSSISSSSATNRVPIPPPVIPKTTLITASASSATTVKPISDLRRVKNDLRPVVTGVTPHSTSMIKESTKLSSLPSTINNNNNNSVKGKIDPPRYYFPDQIVSPTGNNSNEQLKSVSSSSDYYHHQQDRRSSGHRHLHHHDYITPNESVKQSTNGSNNNNIINITNPCARLKPTARDFIRIQPLTNYQRSPISY